MSIQIPTRTVSAAAGALAACLLLVACGLGGSNPSGSKGSSGSGSGSSGSGSHGSGSANVPNACEIVTAQVAARITGGSNLTQVGNQTAGGVSECLYLDTTAGTGGVTVIVEQVPTIAGAATLQAAMAQANKNGNNGNNVAISGLGDQAYKDVEQNSSTVAAAKGNTLIVIGVTGQARTGAQIESDEEGIVRQILSKL